MADDLAQLLDRFEVPDLAEAILGYRWWRIADWWTQDQSGLTVHHYPSRRVASAHSATPGHLWDPCIPLKAECTVRCGSPPSPPSDAARHFNGHGCGIYGYATLGDLLESVPWQPAIALGQVLLWGRVWPYEHGYRAEYGQVAAFYRGATENLVLTETAASYDVHLLKLELPHG